MAAPFFIVSSGRSGTAMLHKLLSAEPDIEMHHEYMVHIVQPLAVKRYQGLIGSDEAVRVLEETHIAAIRHTEKPFWGDSSNKLSWLIPELAMLCPQAKFVHLVRDGRKVASSYFHKLGDECYDNRSTRIFQRYLDGTGFIPPPEKKYWWPVPRPHDALADAFCTFDQFQRIAWHWTEINRVIVKSLTLVPRARQHFVRLEDLQASPSAVRELFGFLDLAYRESHFAAFARPHNVNRPEDRLLTPMQRVQFDAIASEAMTQFGYDECEEYVVNY